MIKKSKRQNDLARLATSGYAGVPNGGGVAMVRLFTIALLLLVAAPAHAGVLALSKLWTNTETLRVCFFGGSPKARVQIAALASQWSARSGIKFDFGRAPEFDSCAPTQRHEIRVGFGDIPLTYIGTD